MLNNIEGIIFDLDGTLIDSLWIWDKIDFEYLNKRNIPVPKNLKAEIGHLSFDEVAQYFKDTFNILDDIKSIQKEWMDMAYEEYTKNVPLKPGVKKFLDLIKKSNIKIGLATSNCHLLLETVLKSHGIYDYFDSITLTNEVSKGKEHPDVYLLAAERLNINPENCLVFEDILPAIQGAKSAGMKVICVSDEYCIYDKSKILEFADHFITSYDEIAI